MTQQQKTSRPERQPAFHGFIYKVFITVNDDGEEVINIDQSGIQIKRALWPGLRHAVAWAVKNAEDNSITTAINTVRSLDATMYAKLRKTDDWHSVMAAPEVRAVINGNADGTVS